MTHKHNPNPSLTSYSPPLPPPVGGRRSATPTVGRHLKSWPFLHHRHHHRGRHPTERLAPRPSLGLVDECVPALEKDGDLDESDEEEADRRLCWFLGQRGTPEGRECDSTTCEDELKRSTLSLVAWEEELLKEEEKKRREPPPLKLPSFVRDRLARRISVRIPLPPPRNFQGSGERDGAINELDVESKEKRVKINEFDVFLSWASPVDETCGDKLVISHDGFVLFGEEVRWSDVSSAEISHSRQMIHLRLKFSRHSRQNINFFCPKRADCVHLCSWLAYHGAKVETASGRDLEGEALGRLATVRLTSSLPNTTADMSGVASTSETSKGHSMRAAWKSLQSRAKDGWNRGFLELRDDAIFLSQSLDRVPCRLLSPTKDVRLVEVDSRVRQELPVELQGVVRLGVDVFVAVANPQELMTHVQAMAAKVGKVEGIMARKDLWDCEKRVHVILRDKGDLRLDFGTQGEELNVDLEDVAAVFVGLEESDACLMAMKRSFPSEGLAVLLRFPGEHERNDFVKALRRNKFQNFIPVVRLTQDVDPDFGRNLFVVKQK